MLPVVRVLHGSTRVLGESKIRGVCVVNDNVRILVLHARSELRRKGREPLSAVFGVCCTKLVALIAIL